MGKDKRKVFGRWDKAWYAMRQMRKDWAELPYADKTFLTWAMVRAGCVEDLRCCMQPHFGPDRGYPYTCRHDIVQPGEDDGIVGPKQFDCCLFNPNCCRRVHEPYIRASAFFDVARPDENSREEVDIESKNAGHHRRRKSLLIQTSNHFPRKMERSSDIHMFIFLLIVWTLCLSFLIFLFPLVRGEIFGTQVLAWRGALSSRGVCLCHGVLTSSGWRGTGAEQGGGER